MIGIREHGGGCQVAVKCETKLRNIWLYKIDERNTNRIGVRWHDDSASHRLVTQSQKISIALTLNKAEHDYWGCEKERDTVLFR